jgi:hypothetical protein
MLKALGDQTRTFSAALKLMFGNRAIISQENIDKLDRFGGNVAFEEPPDFIKLLGDSLQKLPDGRFMVDLRSVEKLNQDLQELGLPGFTDHVRKLQSHNTHIDIIRAVAQLLVSVLLVGMGIYVLVTVDNPDIRMAATGWIGMVGGYWLR